jgi:alkanesulfonate monooxygenase SsuD/methylene tetrahydromethanopterin reductase-like flavin-dependent oxidoreductase (luciferase family)
MRVFSFHLMPYPGLPDDYHGPAWVTVPNQIFDPQVGHEIYNRYLDELIYADELGFDGICINEHHQNAYGLMPSPNLMGSILARQTRQARICIVGNALPLYDPPTRVAEEFAMIDNISGGRLIAGFVVGGGPEYYSFSINPAHARERFYEAHEIVIKAWTEPGPTEYIGKHYKLRFMNTWPRPIQQPHPEVWIPGAGSLETMEFVARHRYAYMGIPYFHISVFDRQFRMFREACEREGYTYEPRQAGWLEPIYVAETDEQARTEYEPHFWYWARKLLPGIEISPPGYTSLRSLENILKGRHQLRCRSSRGTRSSTASTRSSAPPTRCTRSWWRTSSASGPGTCWGCSSSGRFRPTSPVATSSCSPPRSCLASRRASPRASRSCNS